MQIERGPGRCLSQALPGPDWAEKRPKICDVRMFGTPPTKNLNNLLTALEGWFRLRFSQMWPRDRYPWMQNSPKIDPPIQCENCNVFGVERAGKIESYKNYCGALRPGLQDCQIHEHLYQN